MVTPKSNRISSILQYPRKTGYSFLQGAQTMQEIKDPLTVKFRYWILSDFKTLSSSSGFLVPPLTRPGPLPLHSSAPSSLIPLLVLRQALLQ